MQRKAARMMVANANTCDEMRFAMITAELRWFGQGPIPGVWSTWFNGVGEVGLNAKDSEQRSDCYLCDPMQTSLSVKRRARIATLEVKGLIGSAGRLDVPPFRGEIERWAKWPLRSIALTPSIEVKKQRWLRTFVIVAGVAVEAGSQGKDQRTDDEGTGEGCGLELTRLTLPDQTAWWTLGLEAFGTADSLATNLHATALHLADRLTANLDATVCCGYPEWLSRLPCVRSALK